MSYVSKYFSYVTKVGRFFSAIQVPIQAGNAKCKLLERTNLTGAFDLAFHLDRSLVYLSLGAYLGTI